MRTPAPRLSGIAGLMLGALFSLSGHAGAQSHNVLVIIADDLGADSFPLTATAGASLPPMPNITALKNSGVLFRNARSQPTCSPTRASMLTGRHPFRTGIGAQLTGATSPQLQASEFTLPEAFAANAGLGYSLAMFGKWHLNSGAGTERHAAHHRRLAAFCGHDHRRAAGLLGVDEDHEQRAPRRRPTTRRPTRRTTRSPGSPRIAGQPWFAWAAFNAPHAPLHFPPNDLHSYDAAATTNRNQYEAMCEALDTEVGRLLADGEPRDDKRDFHRRQRHAAERDPAALQRARTRRRRSTTAAPACRSSSPGLRS